MKKYKGWFILLLFFVVCFGVAKLVLNKTAVYPTVDEEATYVVNQLKGFDLSIEALSYSPFKGYTIRYKIDLDSNDVYYLMTGTNPPTVRLEKLVGEKWYLLNSEQDEVFENTIDLGGSHSRSFQGSMVQKYDGYGTRLEIGTYRFTVELVDDVGNKHYLSAQFEVE